MTKLVVKEITRASGSKRWTLYERTWDLHRFGIATWFLFVTVPFWIWFRSARLKLIYKYVYADDRENVFKNEYNKHCNMIKQEQIHQDRIKVKSTKYASEKI